VAKLSEAERKKIIELIEAGKPLPSRYRSALFGGGEADYVEATKNYRLVYQGKMSKEEVLRTTPAAPQCASTDFCSGFKRSPYRGGSRF